MGLQGSISAYQRNFLCLHPQIPTPADMGQPNSKCQMPNLVTDSKNLRAGGDPGGDSQVSTKGSCCLPARSFPGSLGNWDGFWRSLPSRTPPFPESSCESAKDREIGAALLGGARLPEGCDHPSKGLLLGDISEESREAVAWTLIQLGGRQHSSLMPI